MSLQNSLLLQQLVLRLHDPWQFFLKAWRLRAPAKELPRPPRLSPGVHAPAQGLEVCQLERLVLVERKSIGSIKVASLGGLDCNLLGQLAPHVLSVLGEEIALLAPQLGVVVAGGSCLGEKDEEVAQVVDVDVVPVGLAGTDDGGLLVLEGDPGQLVNLATASGNGASARTFNLVSEISFGMPACLP